MKDRMEIKQYIVGLMLNTPSIIQKQLSASLEIICESDFPKEWEGLLPELISKLNTTDYNVIFGVLKTILSVFKRFRHAMKSSSVLEELQYVLKLIQEPLLTLFQSISNLIDTQINNEVTGKVLFNCIKIILKLFYCLNSVDLPEYFEDHMPDWMNLFRKYLILETTNSYLIGDIDDDAPSLLHKIQSLVCSNINLYEEKYEEEFQPYLQTFLKDVWSLLMKPLNEIKYDKLVASAIRFLTSVTTGVNFELFKDAETLKGICEKIVIPNMELRDSDLELFEDNPIEFIRRDIEGADSDTRRKASTELVKGLRKHFEQQVTEVCSQYITTMLSQYNANNILNWKCKDAAIYLVTALAVKSITADKGTTNVNQLVPILDFFQAQIWPELQNNNPPALILKADAIKFIVTFRQQLPKSIYINLFPLLIDQLLSPNYVVHTYSANCIEKLIMVKDKVGTNYVNRITIDDYRTYLPSLLINLFKVLTIETSKENDYVMKCIMRVVSTTGQDMLPFATECVNQLLVILGVVSKNPANPSFNHYLFESIASVIRNLGTKSPQILTVFESQLFVPFQFILQTDIQEFTPYVFQILSLLLEVTSTTVSNTYMTIFPALLTPLLWERQGNIPALVRLLQAYLQKGSRLIVQSNSIPAILGIFQKLIASKTHDHEGFYILESIVEYCSPEEFSQYMPQVFTLIFTRLSKDKTLKFIKSFLVWLSLFIGKHNATLVVTQVDTVQKDLFSNILNSLWLPNIQKVSGKIERKMASIAMTKLICDCQIMLNQPYFPDQWCKLFACNLSVLEEAEDETVPSDVNDEIEIEDISGYSTAFSQLVNAIKVEQDPFKDIDPKQYLAIEISKLSKSFPNRFLPILQSSIGANGLNLLNNYFRSVPQLTEPYLL